MIRAIAVSIWIVAHLRLHKYQKVQFLFMMFFINIPIFGEHSCLSGSFICQICKAESGRSDANSSIQASGVLASGFSVLAPKNPGKIHYELQHGLIMISRNFMNLIRSQLILSP